MTSYATVQDRRTKALAHGGDRLVGYFVVVVDGKDVWGESNTWHSSTGANRRCQRLRKLLQEAYDKGYDKGYDVGYFKAMRKGKGE